jgi:hypothetical protein
MHTPARHAGEQDQWDTKESQSGLLHDRKLS